MAYDNNIYINSIEWIVSLLMISTGFLWVDILIVIASLLIIDSIVQEIF